MSCVSFSKIEGSKNLHRNYCSANIVTSNIFFLFGSSITKKTFPKIRWCGKLRRIHAKFINTIIHYELVIAIVSDYSLCSSSSPHYVKNIEQSTSIRRPHNEFPFKNRFDMFSIRFRTYFICQSFHFELISIFSFDSTTFPFQFKKIAMANKML